MENKLNKEFQDLMVEENNERQAQIKSTYSFRIALGWIAFTVYFYDMENATDNLLKSLETPINTNKYTKS